MGALHRKGDIMSVCDRLCIVTAMALGNAAAGQHPADFDADGLVGLADYASFHDCAAGPNIAPAAGCWVADPQLDVDVDLRDFAALQRDFGVELPEAARVAGIWNGTGQASTPQNHPLELTLAQWGHRVLGEGDLTVNPADPINGIPSVHWFGLIYGDTLTVGSTGRLDNACFGGSVDSFVVTATYDAAAESIVIDNVVTYTPSGCAQLLFDLSVTRSDADYVPGNLDILGTWSGQMVTPPGWFYANIPIWPPRETFLPSGAAIEGWMEFCPGCNWGLMTLNWNPATQAARYHWVCQPFYSYKGVVDGNKFSGIFQTSPGPDSEFDGVFSYTLQPVVTPPIEDPDC